MNTTTVARSVPVQRGQQADPVTEMSALWAARFEQKALPDLVQLDPTALRMTRHRADAETSPRVRCGSWPPTPGRSRPGGPVGSRPGWFGSGGAFACFSLF